MSQKRYGSKDPDAFRKKKIRDLASDDYVDSSERTDISESDLHAPFGANVRDSDAESREEKALRSWARREEENEEVLRENLSKSDLNALRAQAKVIGIKDAETKSRDELIEQIIEAAG